MKYTCILSRPTNDYADVSLPSHPIWPIGPPFVAIAVPGQTPLSGAERNCWRKRTPCAPSEPETTEAMRFRNPLSVKSALLAHSVVPSLHNGDLFLGQSVSAATQSQEAIRRGRGRPRWRVMKRARTIGNLSTMSEQVRPRCLGGAYAEGSHSPNHRSGTQTDCSIVGQGSQCAGTRHKGRPRHNGRHDPSRYLPVAPKTKGRLEASLYLLVDRWRILPTPSSTLRDWPDSGRGRVVSSPRGLPAGLCRTMRAGDRRCLGSALATSLALCLNRDECAPAGRAT